MLTTIFDNNFFEFKGKLFQQIYGLPMGNSLSGTLAILFMDKLERRALSTINTVLIYKRYVDDTFIMTTNRTEANSIHTILNNEHPKIKFEIEHPDSTNSISLLDFRLTSNADGSILTEFYEKTAKSDLLIHYRSGIPTSSKRFILENEIHRRTTRCNDVNRNLTHVNSFKERMKINGYPENFLHKTNKNRRPKRIEPSKPIYFEFPFINDKIDHKIKTIFRQLDLPVRLFRKSNTLRQALKPKTHPSDCSLTSCKFQSRLCRIRNCVYKMECQKCLATYVGSTIREFHYRYKEHLSNQTSAIFQHRRSCNASFETTIIAKDIDPIKLRFKEAILIEKLSPSLNSRTEREEMKTLIFI